jgi:quercetin dioxygenase-like cupin family protein
VTEGQAPIVYTRLYADDQGHSRFEDVRLTGEVRGVAESELRALFSAPFPARQAMFRYVVEEASDEHPHNTPRRQFIVQLTGECEIEASDGERRRLVPGSVLLLEDTDGLGHVTRRVGDEDRLTLLIPLD